MMGDNRDNSEDSRCWGFLPREHVKGKALFLYISFGEGPGSVANVRWANPQADPLILNEDAVQTRHRHPAAERRRSRRPGDVAVLPVQGCRAAGRPVRAALEPEEIQANIIARASALDVPVRLDDIKVSRDATRTVAEGYYIQPVQFFPNYSYPVKFTFLVDAVSLGEPLRVSSRSPARGRAAPG